MSFEQEKKYVVTAQGRHNDNYDRKKRGTVLDVGGRVLVYIVR